MLILRLLKKWYEKIMDIELPVNKVYDLITLTDEGDEYRITYCNRNRVQTVVFPKNQVLATRVKSGYLVSFTRIRRTLRKTSLGDQVVITYICADVLLSGMPLINCKYGDDD